MYKSVKPITITLPLELIAQLDSLSKESGKKKTSIVSEALEMYLDFNDIKVAQSRLSDKNIEADDFFKELGV